jgi:hypothetical protein
MSSLIIALSVEPVARIQEVAETGRLERREGAKA